MNSFNYSCMRISFIMIILFRASIVSLGILKFRPYFRILARNSYKLSFKLFFLTDVSGYCESCNFWENSSLNLRHPFECILPTRESMRLEGCLKFRVHIEKENRGLHYNNIVFLPSKGPFSLLGVNVNEERENHPL